jgi:uncharacterized damage-inducible protein DinB
MTNACNALRRVFISGINKVLEDIINLPDDDVSLILDDNTEDEDCMSIRAILSHILFSTRRHLNYILSYTNNEQFKISKYLYSNVKSYFDEFEKLKEQVTFTLNLLTDDMLEQNDTGKKIITDWYQSYDIEQLLEHSIVHCFRHHIQIQKFIEILRLRQTSSFNNNI